MAVVSNTGQNAYKNDLEGLFDTIQEDRSGLLSTVRDAQLAARLLAVDEAARITKDVDPADPRVARYTNASAAILRRAAALEVETQIANIRTPPVTKTETLLQGRITDESAKASAHVTVTLVDQKGAPVAGIAPVETDDSGYYAFVLQPSQVEAVGEKSLTLQVGSDSGKLVPTAAKPFTLASGKITVNETRLQPSELEALRLRVSVKDLARATASATKTASAKSATATKEAAATKSVDVTAERAPVAKKKTTRRRKPPGETKG